MKKIKKKDEIINNILLNIAKVNRRLNISINFRNSFNIMRHRFILKRIDPILRKAYIDTATFSRNLSSNQGPIWIFWWQGEKEMPYLVKKCYESVKKNLKNKKLILVTKDNFRKYTDISQNIIEKQKKGRITLTHFSDILRFNLLKNHGGLWLDATVFITKDIPQKYFSQFFTCSGFEDKDYFFIAKGRWTGFIIGGCKNSPLFKFMDNFFELYWKENDFLIDYFLIDYALFFAWERNLNGFKEYTNNNWRLNNPCLFDLSLILNSPFDKDKYSSIQKNTEMYKLSYKKSLSRDEGTFFDYVVKNNQSV